MTRSMRRTSAARWLVWMPVMMVASLLYWTVALGMGGLSLIAVSALSGGGMIADIEENPQLLPQVPDPTATEPVSGASEDALAPIVVHLEESAEPEDVNDNAGAVYATPVDDAAAVAPAGPGPGSPIF